MKKSSYLDDSRQSIDWVPQSIDWDHSRRRVAVYGATTQKGHTQQRVTRQLQETALRQAAPPPASSSRALRPAPIPPRGAPTPARFRASRFRVPLVSGAPAEGALMLLQRRALVVAHALHSPTSISRANFRTGDPSEVPRLRALLGRKVTQHMSQQLRQRARGTREAVFEYR